jgi:hypothetical protein
VYEDSESKSSPKCRKEGDGRSKETHLLQKLGEALEVDLVISLRVLRLEPLKTANRLVELESAKTLLESDNIFSDSREVCDEG